MGAESQLIRSADLWDARTDSRFVAWDDTSKGKLTSKGSDTLKGNDTLKGKR